MNHQDGDLIQLAKAGQFDVIVHGCNCMCRMGRGIALAIKNELPDAYAADQATQSGDRNKLGTCTAAVINIDGHTLTVVNAYTQYDWKGAGVLVDYDAVRACMEWIKHHYTGKRIGLPLIGAGLARGDWATIEAIISDTLVNEDVTIVHYQPHSANKP